MLRVQDVTKSFGATQALRGVSFDVRRGEVHALLGENGAGKSTLLKVLAGVHAPDAGGMELLGQPYRPRGPAAARRVGVAMIHQELCLAPHLTVAENLHLGAERARWGVVRAGEQRRAARAVLARLGHGELDPDTRVETLPLALRQVVEIARAVAHAARVLILDEPTSSLGEADAARLFALLAELRSGGLGIVYVSHFLDEVRRIGDRCTVLRDGAVAGGGRLDDCDDDALVRLMVGRPLAAMFPRVPHGAGAPLVEIAGLGGRRAPLDLDLTLYAGEILGLAGLVGAGRSETLRCLFGLDPVRAGSARLAGGRPLARSPRASIAAGVGLLSEDRAGEGLALDLPVAANLTLSGLGRCARGGFLLPRAERAAAAGHGASLRIAMRSPDQPVRELSGGNQQKVAFARLLHQDARVLLLDEPTRGIDVATKAELYAKIGALAAAGRTVVLVSSYLPELLHVCDRIAVFRRGRMVEVRAAADWNEEDLVRVAAGGQR
ncbi:MAG: sugar ABC transporter ATP-binding protein [Planctomycetes bacterium]|nr:sugar ABC transporter ATP-binding protein [Planctomycetota bacterium]